MNATNPKLSFLGAVMFVFACSPAAAADAVSIRLPAGTTGCDVAWHFGIERGDFKREGIDLTVVEGAGAAETVRQVAIGADQFGLADGASIIKAVAAGAPVRSVMSLHSASGAAVIHRRGSGLRSLKDLEGRSLGVDRGQPLKGLWSLVVKANNLDRSKIQELPLSPQALGSALIAKKIDAMLGHVIEHGAPIRIKGVDLDWFRFSDHGVNSVDLALITSEHIIENKPDLIRRFVRATQAAWGAYRVAPKQAVKAAMRRRQNLDPALTFKQALLSIELMDSVSTRSKQVGWQANKDWVDTVDQLVALDALKAGRAATAFYTNLFLPEVR